MLIIVPMDERADFVKKIENELRKPKADQNQDLLAFWNGQLNSLNAGMFDLFTFYSVILLLVFTTF